MNSPQSRGGPRHESVQAIGNDIYLHDPLSVRDPASDDPALVILCTWLGGSSPRRVSKYIAGYRTLFPSSSILLLEARIAEITVLPFSALHARLKPARDAIAAILSPNLATGGLNSSTLLHIFSHGGCNTAIQLAKSFQNDREFAQSEFDLAKHLHAIVFDCCPGDTSFGKSYEAAAASLPKSWAINAVGRLLLYPSIGTLSTLQSVGMVSSVDGLRMELNMPEMFGLGATRLYIYSRADRMVRWEDVESHMKEARESCGIAVSSRAFADSAHCAIVREHHDEYWAAIRSFWAERYVQIRAGKGVADTPRL